MKYVSLAVLVFTSFAHASGFDKEALALVPGGKILSTEENEFVVQTKNNSLVEVEFNNDGSLDEASGKKARQDVFVPKDGLLSLAAATEAMSKAGKSIDGEWSLEKGFMKDWEYEFEGVEAEKRVEYSMNAKTGEITKTEFD